MYIYRLIKIEWFDFVWNKILVYFSAFGNRWSNCCGGFFVLPKPGQQRINPLASSDTKRTAVFVGSYHFGVVAFAFYKKPKKNNTQTTGCAGLGQF